MRKDGNSAAWMVDKRVASMVEMMVVHWAGLMVVKKVELMAG